MLIWLFSRMEKMERPRPIKVPPLTASPGDGVAPATRLECRRAMIVVEQDATIEITTTARSDMSAASRFFSSSMEALAWAILPHRRARHRAAPPDRWLLSPVLDFGRPPVTEGAAGCQHHATAHHAEQTLPYCLNNLQPPPHHETEQGHGMPTGERWQQEIE